MLPRLERTTLRLRRAGIAILAGTDVAADCVPGFALHDELDLLAANGLTPLEVLQAATLRPAEIIRRTADYGAAEPGKIADLLLLDADPARDARALRRIDAVVLHGRPLDRRAINALLIEAAREAEAS